VANSSDISRSPLKRFGQSLGRWLEQGQLPTGVQIFVGVFLFVAGVSIQRLLELGLLKVFEKDNQGKIWLIVFLYTLSAIVLTIVASIWIGSLRAVIQRVTTEHQTTRKDIDHLGLRFGLTAEYIDDSARTYRRTQELVETSKESLTFVDWWVASCEYNKTQERKDYYQAITARIEKHLEASRDGRGASGDFSHRRIVQVPEGVDLENVSSVLSKDGVYWEHLEKCVELQEDNEGITSVSIARLFTHTHFAIIDDLYLVEPILTTGKRGLARHGAIFYTDPHGELINRYKQMIRMFHERTVEEEHITTDPHGEHINRYKQVMRRLQMTRILRERTVEKKHIT
jgi:hypothetical protein